MFELLHYLNNNNDLHSSDSYEWYSYLSEDIDPC